MRASESGRSISFQHSLESFITLWKVLEEGGCVGVRSSKGELLELRGELRKVSVVVGVGVQAGVNVVRHVAGAVVQICCKKEEKLG